jgi:hypothetical protein
VFIAAPGTDNGTGKALTLLWLAVALYLVLKLANRWRRAVVRAPASASAGASKNSAAWHGVEWMLLPATSSPSRADATRQLPDYCARLIHE